MKCTTAVRWERGDSGFTLLELLVTIGIILVLAALLAASSMSIRERAHAISCQQNLRVIGQGMLQYSGEHNGFFPPHWGNENQGPTLTWYGFLAPYITDWNQDISRPMDKVFFCPSVPVKGQRTYTSTVENARNMSYGFNYLQLANNPALQPYKAQRLNAPSRIVLVCDVPAVEGTEAGVSLPSFMKNYLLYPAAAVLSRRHGGNCNLVFADGHVESRNAQRLAGEEFDAGNWDPRYQ